MKMDNSALTGVLREYDRHSDKPLVETKILRELESLWERVTSNEQDQLRPEILAFTFVDFSPRRDNPWQTYYWPVLEGATEEGVPFQYPSLEYITEGIIEYWANRAEEAQHPVMKARYASLVWDFSKKITGQMADFRVAQIAVDSYVEAARKRLYERDGSLATKLERALGIALSLKDENRLAQAIEIIIEVELQEIDNDKFGRWGFSYNLLVDNNKVRLSEQDERRIISYLEDRLSRSVANQDVYAAEKASLSLACYYQKENESKEIRRVLLNYGEVVKKRLSESEAMLSLGWLERLYKVYFDFGLKEDADSLLVDIRTIGSKASNEMSTISCTIELSNRELQEATESFVEGGLSAALMRIAFQFVPLKKEVIERLDEYAEVAPLSYILGRGIQDYRGRTVASIGSLKDDPDGHVIYEMAKGTQFMDSFLKHVIDTTILKYSVDAESVLDYLYRSPIFPAEKRSLLRRGLQAYLNQEFDVALHLLIPQIEDIIRNLLESMERPVLKKSRNGSSFQLKLLDELLRDESLVKILGSDMCLYFRVLLTDSRGLNIRNNVCHGLLNLDDLDAYKATRVVHVLLCLALVKN